jgi:hypothetical protein
VNPDNYNKNERGVFPAVGLYRVICVENGKKIVGPPRGKGAATRDMLRLLGKDIPAWMEYFSGFDDDDVPF